MNVPYFDLDRARQRIDDELAERWRAVLADTAFVLGPEVRDFEAAFAGYLGAAGCAGVANGTDALTVALRALGLTSGDEVIVPAFTFFATAECVVLAGGVPVFADVDPATLNLDPAEVERRITGRTAGVIGVHLYGRPFDATALGDLCGAHDLWLLEDAAQAHGASWQGARVGTLGDLAAWSFYPTKNLGGFGDGGAVTGGDETLLEKVRRIANHGQEGRYHHTAIGTNSRLDSLQAAVLNCRLPLLDGDNERRRQVACRYQGGLGGVGDLTFPEDPADAFCVYHQFAVRPARREELREHLAAHGVGSSVHYPSALNRQPAFADHPQFEETLAVSEAAAAECLCLPLFPEITDDEVDRVCEVVKGFFS